MKVVRWIDILSAKTFDVWFKAQLKSLTCVHSQSRRFSLKKMDVLVKRKIITGGFKLRNVGRLARGSNGYNTSWGRKGKKPYHKSTYTKKKNSTTHTSFKVNVSEEAGKVRRRRNWGRSRDAPRTRDYRLRWAAVVGGNSGLWWCILARANLLKTTENCLQGHA